MQPLPTTQTPPLTAADLRTHPEDFEVTELGLCEPDGSGEHLWVWVKKRDWTTQSVARQLARWAGVANKSVSFAGQKDKHAVTAQWFSIHLPGVEEITGGQALPEGVEVLRRERHSRKLRRGALKGNTFKITLRNCQGDKQALENRVQAIVASGFPNYFTEQRFGRDGDNIQRALSYLSSPPRREKNREKRASMISTARSWIFNLVLAERVKSGHWIKPMTGDLMLLDGSNSLFLCETIDEAIIRRIEQNDIHPTGPLAGKPASLQPDNDAAQLEQQIIDSQQQLFQGLMNLKVESARRALRVVPKNLQIQWLDDTTLTLNFDLPSGSYATALLRELVPYSDQAVY